MNWRENWQRPLTLGSSLAGLVFAFLLLYSAFFANYPYPESWPQAIYTHGQTSLDDVPEYTAPISVDTQSRSPDHEALQQSKDRSGNDQAISTQNVKDKDIAKSSPKTQFILTNVGVSLPLFETTLDSLPPHIGLAFPSALPDLEQLVDAAHAKQHDVFIQIPLADERFPATDYGPYTIFPDDDRNTIEGYFSKLAERVSPQQANLLITGDTDTLSPARRRLIERQATNTGYKLLFIQAQLSDPVSLETLSKALQTSIQFPMTVPASLQAIEALLSASTPNME